ncbi:hypothetical protein [Bifidobacterium sp. B4142]|uniref:hypothetical protein n=1 Tax=Bifidobacterium sp. B4142 TaxID=2817962 RepID=UPI00226B1D50|nr:hypothetical protein [Bifidobacterium sp. B4142]MCX8688032.1 hypothetical protein [Bifidobacterium sp. B4142]
MSGEDMDGLARRLEEADRLDGQAARTVGLRVMMDWVLLAARAYALGVGEVRVALPCGEPRHPGTHPPDGGRRAAQRGRKAPGPLADPGQGPRQRPGHPPAGGLRPAGPALHHHHRLEEADRGRPGMKPACEV